MRKARAYMVSLLTTLAIGLIAGVYFFDLNKSSNNKKSALNEYLIFSIQQIVKEAPENRARFLSETDNFADLSEHPNLSLEKEVYYWFTFDPRTAAERGLEDINSGTKDFSGYYVVITPSGIVTDFGFHKP